MGIWLLIILMIAVQTLVIILVGMTIKLLCNEVKEEKEESRPTVEKRNESE